MKRPTDQSWVACPAGELSRFASRRRSQRRTRLLGAFALCALTALVAQRWVAGGLPAVVHPLEPTYGGIVCSAVRARIDQFVDGKLAAATVAQIEAHARHCPPCRALIAAAGGHVPGEPAAIHLPPLEHFARQERSAAQSTQRP